MQSENRILVFLPKGFTKNAIGFIRGFTRKTEDTLTFYILDKTISENGVNSIGYCSVQTPVATTGKQVLPGDEWLHINSKTGQVKVNNLQWKYKPEEIESMVAVVEYDYDRFKECETMDLFTENYGEHFLILIEAIRKKKKGKTNNKTNYIHIFCSFFVMVMYKVNLH